MPWASTVANVEVTATRPFLHGRIKAKAGQNFLVPEREARDLERAGLVRRTGGAAEPVAKKADPVPSGPAAPLFVLPPAPLSPPSTSGLSALGDSPEPKRRGRPPGSRNRAKESGGSLSPT